VKWLASSAPPFLVTVAESNTTVTVALLNATIDSGTTAVVSGSIGDALHRLVPGQRVEIWSQAAGSTLWVHLGAANTNSAGVYFFTTAALAVSTSFQARYASSAYLNAANSAMIKASVVLPNQWSINPKLAADTAAAVNVYRVQQGLNALIITPATDAINSCVALNSTGTFCDPGNLASGYLTGPAVVDAWKASPEHNSYLLVDIWGHMTCAAYTSSDAISGNVGCHMDF